MSPSIDPIRMDSGTIGAKRATFETDHGKPSGTYGRS